MTNSIQLSEMRLNLSVKLRTELREAWEYSYAYLFANDLKDDTERLATYNVILDWYDSGVMATTPFFNITMGYTLAKDILPVSMLELDTKEMQKIYLEQGRAAVLDMIEELEQKLGE